MSAKSDRRSNNVYRFVLVSVNAKYIHSSLAASYLLAALGEKLPADEISVGQVEGTINEKQDTIFKRIADEAPDAVGFSCYIWNIEFALSLAGRLKKEHPGTAVILGGPEVSFNSRELLKKHEFVDYILRGEGEYNDNGTILTVGAGDVTFVASGEGHSIRNTGEGDLEFIALILYK